MNGRRIVWLDGLRFAAAMAVVFFHYAFRGAAAGVMPALDLPDWLVGVSKYGYLGVSLFFMISGFVIAWSAHDRSPAEFGAARLARLFPSYAAAVTLTFSVTLIYGAPLFTASIAQYAANLTMLSPAFGHPFMDGAYWSIVLELIFYSWVFMFLAAGIFHSSSERIILVWLAIALFNEFFFQLKPLRLIFLTEFAGFFAAGILIYRLRRGLAGLATIPLLLLSLGVSMKTSLNSLQVIEASYRTDYSKAAVLLLVAAIYAVFFAATFGRAARIPGRILAALGAVTYPLYLLHQHIGYIAINRLSGPGSGAALLAAVIVMALAAAAALWLAVDRPLVPVTRRALMSLCDKTLQSAPWLSAYLRPKTTAKA